MAITARAIQSAVVDAIAKSTDIQAKSYEYFGESASVSGGGTGRQGQSAAPAFAVVCWSRTAGEDDPERHINGTVLLSISDDSITTETETVVVIEGDLGEDDTTVEVAIDTFGGPEKLEILLELVAAEISVISSEIMIIDITYNFEPLEYFPLFVGSLDFTVAVPVLIGGYEPTLT